jgi:hypothetical protein
MPGTLPIGICKNGLVELTANWRAGSSVVDIVRPFICLINAAEGFLAKVTKTVGLVDRPCCCDYYFGFGMWGFAGALPWLALMLAPDSQGAESFL